jgi:hypothetical protein
MENTEIVNTNEQCDSPVYVEKSPVSSPVFVSKETDNESSTQVTDKLILPVLDESHIHPIVDTNRMSSSTVPTSPTAPTSPSAPTTQSNKSNTTHIQSETGDTREMVSVVVVVVKDFAYCQEEFLKQVKENNLEVTPETVMRLLRIAMIIVEQTNESGSNKKAFVINLLKEIVMNNKVMLPEHKLEALNLITGNIVSDSIDFLIDASKGKFDINKVEKIAEEVAKSCFTRCWGILAKKK